MRLRDAVGTGCGKDDVPPDRPNETVHEPPHVVIGRDTYKLMEDTANDSLHRCTSYSVKT